MASFARQRRLEPRSARASRRCCTFNRLASPRLRPGACSSSPVDNAADTATPRSIPTTLPSPGPAIGSGTWANAMCQRPARSRVTRKDFTPRDRLRQAEAHPAHLGHPHPTKPAVQTLDVVRFDPDLPESLVHTGFAPRRAAVGSVEKVAHRLSEVSQRLLLHRLRSGRQPIVLGAGRSQLSTLLVVSRRTTSGLPVLVLLDGQVPYIPGVATMLGQHHCLFSRRKQPISRHTGNITLDTDKSPKGDTAPPPPAKARGFRAAKT